jgi:hypothetical protein
MRACRIGVRNRFENPVPPAALIQGTSKIFEPTSYRLGHFADDGGSSPPMGRRQTHQRPEVGDKRIAVVFEVKFEPLGRKYCCASRGSAILSCKRQCGVLKQENSADPPFDVTGNPEAFLVTADEKCGDRLIDDPRIERPKLCGNGWRGPDRQDPGACAFRRDHSRRTPRYLAAKGLSSSVARRSLRFHRWRLCAQGERARLRLQTVASGY